MNQLILDCLAKVLRINQTTGADLFFEIAGNVNSVACWGYKTGYAETLKEQDAEYPKADYFPLPSCIGSAYGSIYLDDNDSEQQLHNLLDSLISLEKELITK